MVAGQLRVQHLVFHHAQLLFVTHRIVPPSAGLLRRHTSPVPLSRGLGQAGLYHGVGSPF